MDNSTENNTNPTMSTTEADYTKSITELANKQFPTPSFNKKSKIEVYHLGDIIVDMKKAGYTLQEIADEINDKYLSEYDTYISKTTINRYIHKVLPDADKYDQRVTRTIINEYNELMDMLQYTESQLEIAEQTLNVIKNPISAKEFKKASEFIKTIPKTDKLTNKAMKKIMKNAQNPPIRDLSNLLNTQEKILARRQAILDDLAGIKRQMLDFLNVRATINRIIEIVDNENSIVCSKVIKRMQDDFLLQESLKKLPKR